MNPHRSGDNTHAMFRPDAYVVLRILKALWDAGGESRWTALMNAFRLNPEIFSKYIDWMYKKGMIVVKLDGRRRKIVQITKLGVQALDELLKYFL